MWILYILPKKILSHFVGRVAHLQLPAPLAKWSISLFAKIYKIDLREAELEIDDYKSIGELFTRRLKPGIRPIGEGPLLHPADSVIAGIGEITAGRCLQAKGKEYSISELLVEGDLPNKFIEGLFATYYLCPTDYHRVHSPIDGVIKKVKLVPGNLWPVNKWSSENIENLFAVNERIIIEFESRIANCYLVMVGATNVGKIRLSFDPMLVSNQGQTEIVEKTYEEPIKVDRGQEIGLFSMGSTVIMIYPKTIRLQRDDWPDHIGKSVKVCTTFL